MLNNIKNVVKKALYCGDYKYVYIKYKCVNCNELNTKFIQMMLNTMMQIVIRVY